MPDPSPWESPDPRVAWAIKILDNEGYEPTSITDYYIKPITCSIALGIAHPLHNYFKKRPFHTNLPLTLAMAAVGWFGGMKIRSYMDDVRAKRLAMTRYYIMTHPEDFVEPEQKTYGDPMVLLPWNVKR